MKMTYEKKKETKPACVWKKQHKHEDFCKSARRPLPKVLPSLLRQMIQPYIDQSTTDPRVARDKDGFLLWHLHGGALTCDTDSEYNTFYKECVSVISMAEDGNE